MARPKRGTSPPARVSSPLPEPAQSGVENLSIDAARQAWLADLGELAGPMAHGFSNFLNVVLLHVAVLEQECPESMSEDLAELRRQGSVMDLWIRHFQKHRYQTRSQPMTVDVNAAVRSACEPAAATLDLADSLPPIQGCGADVRRLVRLLLGHATSACGPEGTITIRTRLERAVTLMVEDDGPAPPKEHLPQMFEAMEPVRPGTSALELAACRSLVRRNEGVITAMPSPAGGVMITVEFPVAW